MIKFNFALGIVVALALSSCSDDPKPDEIIDQTIQLSGGDLYPSALVEFDFRGISYKGTETKGDYKYARRFKSDQGEVYDVMTNEFFQRSINKKRIELEDSMVEKYRNSINSVFYFARLPYGLNDEAVKKRYLDEVSIGENTYHKIEITFKEEGGGEDFQDIYIYWIDTQTGKTDYLAYSYVVDGGGLRFRKAYNERFVNGIRFVDYINYKADPLEYNLEQLDVLYEKGGLEELSRIELKNVRVILAKS